MATEANDSQPQTLEFMQSRLAEKCSYSEEVHPVKMEEIKQENCESIFDESSSDVDSKYIKDEWTIPLCEINVLENNELTEVNTVKKLEVHPNSHNEFEFIKCEPVLELSDMNSEHLQDDGLIAEYKEKDEIGWDMTKSKVVEEDNVSDSTHEKKIYKCPECSYEFKQKSFLKMHLLVHKNPTELEMFKCHVCSAEFKRKNDIRRHLLVHKDPAQLKMLKCNVCSSEFKRKSDLRMHQRTHKDPSQLKMFKCDGCTFESKYKSCLQKHQLLHKVPSQLEMFKCNECNDEFKRKSDLELHLRRHKDPSQLKMFKCNECSFETKYRTSLRTHQIVHKGPSQLRMFKCNECGFQTKYKSSLQSHMRMVCSRWWLYPKAE